MVASVVGNWSEAKGTWMKGLGFRAWSRVRNGEEIEDNGQGSCVGSKWV